jgi:hypothetical protein
MPIRYAIQPDLDLLLYIFEGECTGREYLDMYHSIYLDKGRHHGMKVLMDLTNAALEFDTQNLTEATAIVVENKAGGFPPDHVAILTRGASMRFLKETLVVLADNVPMYLDVFNNIYDAVRWLGLAEIEKEAMHFREACLQVQE